MKFVDGAPQAGSNGNGKLAANQADSPRTSPASDFRLEGDAKTFVLDTNVLLHNPNAIFLLANNEIVIPFDVIEELDKFKTGNDDLGRNARTVIRHLDRLREAGNLAKGVPIPETGGLIRVVLPQEHSLSGGLFVDSPDNRIISIAYSLHKQGKRVVFISKDIDARIKSDTLGIPTEDFEAQKVDFERLYTGWRELIVPNQSIQKLFSEKQLEFEADPPLNCNEFVLLRDEQDPNHTALARYHGDTGTLQPVRPRRTKRSALA